MFSCLCYFSYLFIHYGDFLFDIVCFCFFTRSLLARQSENGIDWLTVESGSRPYVPWYAFYREYAKRQGYWFFWLQTYYYYYSTPRQLKFNPGRRWRAKRYGVPTYAIIICTYKLWYIVYNIDATYGTCLRGSFGRFQE